MNGEWEQQRSVEINDPSGIAEARRQVAKLASRIGFSESETSDVSIVLTELATNLLKHAGRGEILARPVRSAGNSGIELLALDKGKGIANLAQCLRDGYSSAGSPGTGLGAMKRLSDDFDLYSSKDKGTAIVARLWSSHPGRPRAPSTHIGAVCLALPGEARSGDAWDCHFLADRSLFAVVDGLGHGLDAAKAAERAVLSIREHKTKAPSEIVERAHDALRGTRGAALAVTEIDCMRGVARFCGIGNIAGCLVTHDDLRHMVSHNGIVGHHVHKIAEFSYPCGAETLLIMHSDGLMTRWNIGSYPGLIQCDPSLIAGVLYRDFARGRDDITVLVAKNLHRMKP